PSTRPRRPDPGRLIFLPQNPVGLAVPPRRDAERLGPGVGVALALDADEHGRGGVLVGFRVAPGLVLADPQVEAIATHGRLDAAVAGRAAGVRRQVPGDAVGDEVGAPPRPPPPPDRLDRRPPLAV